MSHTAADLESAIDKLSTLEFTPAETEAIARAIASPAEVEGFAAQPRRTGQGFLLDMTHYLVAPPAKGDRLKMDDPGTKGFVATDDLA